MSSDEAVGDAPSTPTTSTVDESSLDSISVGVSSLGFDSGGSGSSESSGRVSESQSPTTNFLTKDRVCLTPGSTAEESLYYSGLRSHPRLVYRSGETPRLIPSAFQRNDSHPWMEVVPVFDYKLNHILEELSGEICRTIDKASICWSSIDVVRFKARDQPKPGPVVLWIGIHPGDFETPKPPPTQEAARALGGSLIEILQNKGIKDVEIEMRLAKCEICVGTGVGPFLTHSDIAESESSASHFLHLLTPTLGLPIAAEKTPTAEGTGGLYLKEGPGKDGRTFLLTARHVCFNPKAPPSEQIIANHETYNLNPKVQHNPSKHRIVLLGESSYRATVDTIKNKIKDDDKKIKKAASTIGQIEVKLKEGTVLEDTAKKNKAKQREDMKTAQYSWDAHTKVFEEFLKRENMNERILGHVIYSPPWAFDVDPPNPGSIGHSEDWAIIEVDMKKMPEGVSIEDLNFIDLRTIFFSFKRWHSELIMLSGYQNASSFRFPKGGLFRIRGIVNKATLMDPQTFVDLEALANPDSLERNEWMRFPVLKSGRSSGVTIGRGNGINSIVREYDTLGRPVKTSLEWCVLSVIDKQPFSEQGDSGSIIVDHRGQVAGMLVGGSDDRTHNRMAEIDITYATPFYWLMARIQNKFPDVYIP
ncbi:uncharacterized protein BXZ73DRAFT_38768 [Epithele typhae]|uniref:uncharacterized protein n=1 Tax=Epithele typhae TaxID=378194 RepID=UPI0020086E45|nr:uncharacterized protein BXZ73DRAFT_38768 [Epithele typhae]KAH9945058.1 hypothetical protein BXZ73DRAFT_38768 [Epithele typhae]